MPEIRVQDEKGTIHVFPDGSTPDMIAKAMKVKPPVATLAHTSLEHPDTEGTASKVAKAGLVGVFEGAGVKPSLDPMENVTGTIKQFGKGVKDFVVDTYHANAPQTRIGKAAETPLARASVLGTSPQVVATALDLVPRFIDKTADTLEQGGRETIQAIKDHDWETAAERGAQTLTTAAMLRTGGKAAEGEGLSTVGKLRKMVADKIGLTNVPIGKQQIPVLVGESKPNTFGGRLQVGLKRAGIGAKQFSEVFSEQQAKVKEVIRQTAQQTSGLVGPSAAEPGAAVEGAAEATFAKARPMYNALDQALVTVPDSLSQVSYVVDQAIARAKKLGVEVNTEGNSITVNGRKFTPEEDPQAWKTFQEQGLVGNTTGGQPLSTYMKVRSELLDMKRAATDAGQRYAISKEIGTMTDNIDAALKNTPLWDQWDQATRLWSKGYALRDVADAIRDNTKGTPSAQQAPVLGKVETTVKGTPLVERLNDLQHEGILNRAFTPEEVSNLRQAADILDRASSSVGGDFKVGYGLHSTIARNLIGAPGISPLWYIVKAMMTKAGVQVARTGGTAGLMRLAGALAVTGGNVLKTPGEARDRLRSLAPAAQSQPKVKGMTEPGNIDLHNRPKVKNADGSISTVRSISIEEDGKEVLIPTVVGNRVVSNQEAIREYKRTGKHLGKFDSVEDADRYAEQLHNEQAAEYVH